MSSQKARETAKKLRSGVLPSPVFPGSHGPSAYRPHFHRTPLKVFFVSFAFVNLYRHVSLSFGLLVSQAKKNKCRGGTSEATSSPSLVVTLIMLSYGNVLPSKWAIIVARKNHGKDGRTDRQTDGPTDRRTDGRTDLQSGL